MPKKNKTATVTATNNATKVVSAPVVSAAVVPTTTYCEECGKLPISRDGMCGVCWQKKQDAETTARIAAIKDEDDEEVEEPSDLENDESPSDLEKEDGRRVERVIYASKDECLAHPLVSKRAKKGSTAQQPHEVSEGDITYGWVWAPNGELAIAYVARQKKGWKATTGNKRGMTKEEYAKRIDEAAEEKSRKKMAENYAALEPKVRDIVVATLSPELAKMVWEIVNGKPQ